MISAEQMAAVDRNAAALGVPQKQLMESSGNAIAREVKAVAEPGATVAIVAGRGNNGGDASVAARFLDDYSVTVSLIGHPSSISTDIARENWAAIAAADYETTVIKHPQELDLSGHDIIVDGLLGTGIRGKPREPERSVIQAINAATATVIAVDVPSGMDANTGEAEGHVVEADRVVTFHDLKPGLADLDGVTVADIGIPMAAEVFTGPGDLLFLDRDPASHKGDFGRVFIIGGGPYTGAPALSAQAALRGGADLAYVAAPEPVAREIQGYSADLIVESYPGEVLQSDHVDQLLATAADRDVVILGPGIGTAAPTQAAIRAFLEQYSGRAVIDADALHVVPDVQTDANLICTPHQGELEAMGGSRVPDWEARADHVTEFARELGHTFLVKGPHDVISNGDTTRVNRTGNPGMTVGGTGDVLAGLTGALFAVQPAIRAAAIGAYVNGAAGDAVMERTGYSLVASDLLEELPGVLGGAI